MARIKYSALVENIRGSIAGTTFQNNKHGFTIKSKSNLVSKNSPDQQLRRSFLTRASKAWSTLSDAQRTNWNTWASTYPQYTVHNPSSQLSGYEVFLRTHFWIYFCNKSVVVNPAYTIDVVDNFILSFYLWAGELRLDIFESHNSYLYLLCFFITRPLPPSKIFLGSSPKFIVFTPNADGDININTAYVQKFGVTPNLGDYIGGYYTAFNILNGTVFPRVHFRIQVIS